MRQSSSPLFLPRLGRAFRIIAVNVFVVGVLLLLIEGAVRVFAPRITETGTSEELVADSVFGASPGPRAGASGTSNGAHFSVDENGFWTYSAGFDPSLPSWLFLGDSVTMGIGVAPDSTFAGRMAARLDTMNVLNPSLIGYSSRDYVNVLQSLSQKEELHIRRVTIFWCLNDVYVPAETADPNSGVRRVGGPVLTFVRRYVHTYQWLKATLFDRPKVYFDHDRRLYNGAPLEASIDDLNTIEERCNNYNLNCDVVLLPYEYQIRDDAADSVMTPQSVLVQRLARMSFHLYDPSAYLAAHTHQPSALYLYGDGIHFSRRGHRLIAAYLSAHLR